MSRSEQAASLLSAALQLEDGQTPFPWQLALLQRFLDESRASDESRENEPSRVRALDLPTGLGKTSVMAIWAVARALGAALPRRLVYIVDRRAVVDQATDVASGLRDWLAKNPELSRAVGLNERTRELPISTLRGQHADNRAWLEDPSAPAIVVGTVDMIGSKLLFEGYATSRRMRPYHAGLLGVDALFVLDEAHLVPPFERLLEQVVEYTRPTSDRPDRAMLPGIRLLSLSATGRDHGSAAFGLTDADHDHPEVKARLRATKRLRILTAVTQKQLAEALAERAWSLASSASNPVRCIVFCRRRVDAERASKALLALAKKGASRSSTPPTVELFVGARRVRERQAAAERLTALGFLAGSKEPLTQHAFLFATSAGEVGVDLDADHMVADVVAWERMVQRLGRVNRRGKGDATVLVLPVSDPGDNDPTHDRVLEVLSALPTSADGTHNANAEGLAALKERLRATPALAKLVSDATTDAPLYPALSRPLVESWAMTSLVEHTGRPDVGPWLRGWVEDRSQTTIIFRHWLTELSDTSRGRALDDYLAAAPPHLTEHLAVDTAAAMDWLLAVSKRLRKRGDAPQTLIGVLLDGGNTIDDRLALSDRRLTDSRAKKRLFANLADRTLVLDSAVGGISADGLLVASATAPAVAADSPQGPSGVVWSQDKDDGSPVVPWRVRKTTTPFADRDPRSDWREETRLGLLDPANPDAEPSEWLAIERSRRGVQTEAGRSLSRLQTLDAHHADAAHRAQQLCKRLALPNALATLVELATGQHDAGKEARIWQSAFSSPHPKIVYAKTPGPVFPQRLHGYRHEFGSLKAVENEARLVVLPALEKDLVLHLIAAHHGYARASISWGGSEEPPSKARARAENVALRFIRVQERWGPWGLAWLEALVRAADFQASRDNDEKPNSKTGENAENK